MTKIGVLVFTVVAVMGAPVFADCEGALLKTQRQVVELNPEFRMRAASTQEFYFSLREAEIALKSEGLSESLARHLEDYEPQLYSLRGRSRAELTQFYKNSLRRLILQAAQMLKRELVSEVAPGLSFDGRAAAEQMLASYISPYKLEDEELRLEVAHAVLGEKPWLAFPWTDAVASLGEWEKIPRIQRPGISEVDAWVSAQPASAHWGWNDRQRFARALVPRLPIGRCCLARPGCVTCPVNRRFLREGR